MQAILERRTGRTDIRLSRPQWTSRWRANIRIVDRYREGRVFLAGDAAHIHSPSAGQGPAIEPIWIRVSGRLRSARAAPSAHPTPSTAAGRSSATTSRGSSPGCRRCWQPAGTTHW
jgi:hypothetical protein